MSINLAPRVGPDREPRGGDTAPSFSEYADALLECGVEIIGRTPFDFWIRYESYGLMRLPFFATHPVDTRAVARMVWRTRAAIATYVVEPDLHHPANAWLYVCTDRSYAIDRLAPAVRRNIRRGLRELQIARVSNEAIVDRGFPAYRDSRQRLGLSDGTRDAFFARFDPAGRCRGHSFLGAWHDNELVAFVPIRIVDDWAEIETCFSSTAALKLRPNETLITRLLMEHLGDRAGRLVSYGLSSIQPKSGAQGLHQFKVKLGFEAVPVHRAFVPNPFLRPWLNHGTLRCIRGIMKLAPGSRLLRKGSGALATILSD